MKKCGKIVPPDENYFKLLSYKTSVSEQLIYNRKEQYYSIIEKYLNKNLTLLEFRTQFLNMEEEDIEKGDVIFENRQELEAFYFTEDLQKFYKLIGQLFDLCEDYYFMEPMPEIHSKIRRQTSNLAFFHLFTLYCNIKNFINYT